MKQRVQRWLQGFQQNKAGASAIEIIIGMLMFLAIISFIVDTTTLAWRFNVISQTNTFVARTVGVQGGMLATAPIGYPGGDAAYMGIEEMKQRVEENLEKAGVTPDEYDLTINGTTFTNGSKVDYMEPIETRLQVKYKWAMTSNFVPGSVTNTIQSKRNILSEFKYRYDAWEGE